MSMRAQDVDAQGFGRVMRGYNPQQVDDLLERVRAALTEAEGQQARLREENQQLQGELGQVRQQLDRVSHQLNVYQEMEETIKQTMLMAQRTREEIYSGARAKSSAILADAQLEAQRILEQAAQEAEATKAQAESLRVGYDAFREQVRAMLLKQLELVTPPAPEPMPGPVPNPVADRAADVEPEIKLPEECSDFDTQA